MAILGKVKRLHFVVGEQPPNNTSREVMPPARPSDMVRRLMVNYERYALVSACRDMYAKDSRAEGVLRMLGRDVVKDGFSIVVQAGDRAEQAQKVIDALAKRINLRKWVETWTRLAARDGDIFLELGIDDNMEIAEITRKPTLQMVRLADEFDRFPDPAHAFAWTDLDKARLNDVGADAVFFAWFQIVQGRWNYDGETRYGTPEFSSSLSAYKRVTEGELDIAIRRKTRAGIKYLHVLDGASEMDLERYQEINKASLDNPFAAVADLFTNKAGSVQVLSGDAKLGEIGDVEHHIQTWSAASAVPLELLAYGANLNRDVLGDKRDQYTETLKQVRGWVVTELINPIVDRQLLLAGILPEDVDYAVAWTDARTPTPEQLKILAEAVQLMKQLGWTAETIWTVIRPFLPQGLDMDGLFPEPEEEEEKEPLQKPVGDEKEPEAGQEEPEAEDVDAQEGRVLDAVARLMERLEVAVNGDDY